MSILRKGHVALSNLRVKGPQCETHTSPNRCYLYNTIALPVVRTVWLVEVQARSLVLNFFIEVSHKIQALARGGCDDSGLGPGSCDVPVGHRVCTGNLYHDGKKPFSSAICMCLEAFPSQAHCMPGGTPL